MKFNHLPYQLEKNGDVIADINFDSMIFCHSFTIRANDGSKFYIRSKGMLFWKKIFLMEGQNPMREISSKRITVGNKQLIRDELDNISIDEKIISSIFFDLKRDNVDRIVCVWEHEYDDIEIYILILILFRFQSSVGAMGGIG